MLNATSDYFPLIFFPIFKKKDNRYLSSIQFHLKFKLKQEKEIMLFNSKAGIN